MVARYGLRNFFRISRSTFLIQLTQLIICYASLGLFLRLIIALTPPSSMHCFLTNLTKLLSFFFVIPFSIIKVGLSKR